MKPASLKIRLLLVGALVILLALSLTGFGLIYLFKRHVERRIGSELDTYITQIASRLGFDSNGGPHLDDKLADPRFEKIYSGLYWQIDSETSGRSAHSKSLWDIHLKLPVDNPGFGKVHIHTIKGPLDSSLKVHERRLRFETTSGEQVARLAVAIDLADLEKISEEFGEDVAVALLFLGVFLLLAGWVQIKIGLEPLAMVRQSIAAIRNGAVKRIGKNMPREVAPLAEEVNNLLEAQETAMQRARHRAADLAHGFKTPLTALNADIQRLNDRGEVEIAKGIAALSTVMQRQIDHELTRSRIRDLQKMPLIDVQPVVNGIIETLRRTPAGEAMQISSLCEPALKVQIDKDDLADILGNLVENAVKHAVHEVIVKVSILDRMVRFDIEDDGEGISRSLYESAKKRGVRLDMSVAGSGLGLAIVSDILEFYGQELVFGTSSLKGLRARFELPLVNHL